MADAMALTVQTNKPVFPATGGQQLLYVWLEAQPVGALAAVQRPLNFSLVLDHSGSMSGTKLENLKAAAHLAVEEMTPQDLVSVVIFDDAVQVLVSSQPVSEPGAIKARIDKIRAEGGTRISRGMRAGLDELAKGIHPDRVNRMLLLTDGETYGDEDECRQLAAEAGRQGIAITALGLGEGWNETLLDAIAQASDGASDFIPEGRPDVVRETFRGQVRGAQRTVVQNAMLLLRLSGGVVPRAVWRVTPLISQLSHRAISERDVQISLGDMEHGQGQSVLIELLVPPLAPGTYRLAQAEISYDVPVWGLRNAKVRQDIVLPFSADPLMTPAVNPHVLNIVEKVTAHKLQTRALEEAALGNVAAATQKLRAAATRLLELGETELAEVAQQEAVRLEQGQGLSAGGTKKLRYETRKLTRKLDE